MSHTTEFQVEGMTCGHCEASVKEELSELPGVLDVTASHETGAVSVRSEQPLTEESIREAIAEAGYAVVS